MAIDSIGPVRWAPAIASSRARISIEERAVIWAFLVELPVCLAAEVGDGAIKSLNSYQVVGDKAVRGQWEGDFGKDAGVCLPRCVRALAATGALYFGHTAVL